MHSLDKAIEIIKKFESCSLTAYQKEYNGKKDKVTIGWGNTEYFNGNPILLGDKITQHDADELLNHFVNKTAERVHDLCFPVELTENQFNAVVSLVYNWGVGNFKKSCMLAKIHETGTYWPDISGAKAGYVADEFDDIIKVNGKVVQGLVNRRAEEKALFLKGE